MKREHLLMIYVVIMTLLVGLMVACIIIDRTERRRLEEQIAELTREQTSTGGAETVTQSVRQNVRQNVLFRFPLADGDFREFTSPHGYRVSPLLDIEVIHEGLDIAGAWRSQVVAAADGTVVEHWPPPDGYFRGHDVYGGMIRIQHDNGMETLYAHLSWTRIHTGDQVRAGQVIGRMGNTGRSDGEHLHFEVIADGERLNPLLYMEDPR